MTWVILRASIETDKHKRLDDKKLDEDKRKGDESVNTAVKSNALAELMNRTSKIHWKKLSLTLNGKCGSTTLCGCLWVFLGVCGC